MMATKSILKTVNIKNRQDCISLVNALEHAKDKKAQDVVMSRAYKVATKDDVLKIFGKFGNVNS